MNDPIVHLVVDTLGSRGTSTCNGISHANVSHSNVSHANVKHANVNHTNINHNNTENVPVGASLGSTGANFSSTYNQSTNYSSNSYDNNLTSNQLSSSTLSNGDDQHSLYLNSSSSSSTLPPSLHYYDQQSQYYHNQSSKHHHHSLSKMQPKTDYDHILPSSLLNSNNGATFMNTPNASTCNSTASPALNRFLYSSSLVYPSTENRDRSSSPANSIGIAFSNNNANSMSANANANANANAMSANANAQNSNALLNKSAAAFLNSFSSDNLHSLHDQPSFDYHSFVAQDVNKSYSSANMGHDTFSSSSASAIVGYDHNNYPYDGNTSQSQLFDSGFLSHTPFTNSNEYQSLSHSSSTYFGTSNQQSLSNLYHIKDTNNNSSSSFGYTPSFSRPSTSSLLSLVSYSRIIFN